MGTKVESSASIAFIVLVLVAGERAAGLSCSDAVEALIPCGAFLVGAGGGVPSTQCCNSAQKLNGLTASPASRKLVCECLKENGPSFGVKPQRAKQLPSLCKLTLQIPISLNVDCNKV